MVRPASQFLVKFVAAMALSAFLALAVLGLLLMTGPVSIGPLTPLLAAILNDNLTKYRVELGGAELAWSRADSRLDLLLTNARLKGMNGDVIAAVPSMSIGFSRLALAHGRLTPGNVALLGPSAILMRKASGEFQLGFSNPAAGSGADLSTERSAEFFLTLIAALRGDAEREEAGGRLRYLNRFSIRNAKLTLFDEATKSVWMAPHSLIDFARTRAGLQAHFSAPIEAGGDTFKLNGTAMIPHRGSDTTIVLSLSGLEPSRLATGPNNPFVIWSGVHVPIHGDASFILDGSANVKSGAFWLFAGAGPFAMPGLPSFALNLTGAEIRGSYSAERSEITLSRLSYKGRGNSGTMTGKATLERDSAGRWTAAQFDVTAQDIMLDLPELFSAPGRVERALFRGRIDPSARRLTIGSLELRAKDARLTFEGEFNDRPEGLGAQLNGTIDHFAISQFAKFWPIGPARGARDWIVENVTSGTLHSGVLKIDAQPGELARDILPDKAVQLTFDFDGLSMDYLHGLTPITEGHGHARLMGNRFDLDLDSARIDSLSVSEGHYAVPDLSNEDVPAVIAIRLQGETKALLSVLDMKPLGYPSSYGFSPADVGGRSDARLQLKLPMKKSIRFADVGLSATLEAKAFTLPALYKSLDISAGSLRASITNNQLEAYGDVLLGGSPANIAWRELFNPGNRAPTHVAVKAVLDDRARRAAGLPFAENLQGPLALSLILEGRAKSVARISVDFDAKNATLRIPAIAWSKPSGASGTGHVDLRFPNDGRTLIENIALAGSGLDVKGKAALAPDGELLALNLNPLKAGPHNDVSVSYGRDGKNARIATINGLSLDLSQSVHMLTDAIKKPDDPVRPKTSLQLNAKLTRLMLAHGAVLTNLDGHFSTPGRGISDLTLNAGYAGGGFLSARIDTADAKRWLRVRSAEAGTLTAGLDLTDHLIGGSLILDAALPEAGTATTQPVTGTLGLKSFRITRAPALAKLLTMASFGGIRDLLTGEGIAFESLDMPFTFDNEGLALGPGKAFGPSIGLTLQGTLKKGSGDLDLSGTLVPAYSLNSFLGNVPLIGNLFVSREGEGVIGLTYAITGDASDPRVMVNPLSALAPGFLRRIFQLDEPNAADRSGAPKPATAQ